VEARADESLINQHRNLLKDDELIIVMGKLMPDRFSGGLQMTVQQIWDLAGARCRFGKFLRVKVDRTNGHRPPSIDRLLHDYPAQCEQSEHGELVRGLGVRFSLVFPDFVAEDVLRLEDRKFFPTDAALAGFCAQAHDGQATIVYD
jgi:DNA polymerase-3 subunit alpha